MKKMLIVGMTVLILSMLVIGCGGDDNGGGDIIPSEIQGTWIWNRNNGSGHTITLTVTDSKVTMVESNDPGDNNGTKTFTFTITKVRKGSVQNIQGEDWTEYYFTDKDIGEIMWGLSSDKQKIADPNGNPIDDFPRVYYKQTN